MSALALYAGPTALDWIRHHGLRQEHVKVMVGASGGPKWFVLYGLDRYLFGEFFKGRTDPLALLGSSAGAWRLSCLAQSRPVAAIERLATHYSAQRYSERPDRHEISGEARALLDRVLGEEGAAEIAANPVYHLHVVADRALGLIRSEDKRLQSLGLLFCGLSNALSRRTLRWHFERVIFHGSAAPSAFMPDDMPTRYAPLTRKNLREALMATGSIPGIMEGVRDIPCAPPGIYRDGGITDYHFDLPFLREPGLVLYPHFYPRVTPGWFDKLLPWRNVNPDNFSNVLLLAPSANFVRSLPYGKIPDRRDFEKMDFAMRYAYWQRTLKESERLAEDFSRLLESGRILDHILPLKMSFGQEKRGSR
jgi:hypothetical protein